MPNKSITTTIFPTVFTGNMRLQTIIFKNVSSAGIIYIRNTASNATAVSSSSFDMQLNAGDAFGYSTAIDGFGCIGPWDAISDTAGGVTLAIMATYVPGRPY